MQYFFTTKFARKEKQRTAQLQLPVEPTEEVTDAAGLGGAHPPESFLRFIIYDSAKLRDDDTDAESALPATSVAPATPGMLIATGGSGVAAAPQATTRQRDVDTPQ